MRAAKKLSRLILSGVVGICLLGCGTSDPLNRQAITGQVTFEDKAIDYGSISFSPLNEAAGLGGGAVIEAGKYEISQKRGLPPGDYLVRISCPDMQGPRALAEEAPGESGRPAKERIPKEWNVQSDQKITVTPDGGNRFDFQIP